MRTYICIDLKSFYASVECAIRNLDPLTTNLVVADISRTEKTICLAVSPSLKKLGVSSRPRLFEVIKKVNEVNSLRFRKSRYKFTGKSIDYNTLKDDLSKEIDYIVAKPKMSLYIEVSSKIYSIYLKYISKDDIHVYSIDEVFIDCTDYLSTYNMTAHELAMKMIKDVLKETRITATAGIGPNMYLAKVAMDIVAKKQDPDIYGVRIAEINELDYRKLLWNHKPLTDFWRVGNGTSKRLEQLGLYTMGDIARCSISNDKYKNEDLLYKEFGVNAELLIDHAWGYEPCTIKDVKEYKPINNSLGIGQVLHCEYDYEKTLVIIKEMAEELTQNMISKNLVTNNLTLYISYDRSNLTENYFVNYSGLVEYDYLGNIVPKSSRGSINLDYTNSLKLIKNAFVKIYERIVDKSLYIRKINISASVININEIKYSKYDQIDIFTNLEEKEIEEKNNQITLEKEKKVQEAILNVKKKFGKNSLLKAMNLLDSSTQKERNDQIGGHSK